MIKVPKGKAPYKGTPVPVDRSKEQISKLLRDWGAEGVQWSEDFTEGRVELRFAVKRTDGRTVVFRVVPAAFRERHSTFDPMQGKHVVKELPDWARSLRLLHDWIKTKLLAIAYGLTSVEEEFLAQMVVRDASGEESTVGKRVLPELDRTRGVLALEPPRRVDAEVIEP